LSVEADAVEAAVRDYLGEGYRTPDIYVDWSTRVKTDEAGELIAGYI
jgi:hypothetical protein